MASGFTKLAKNGPYLIAAAGDLRAINILQYAFTPPNPKAADKSSLDKFMTNQFLPALRKCFEDEGYGESSRIDSKDTRRAPAGNDSDILVAVKGVIYEIGGDYSWTRESRSIYAVGSGSDYALGAAYALYEEDLTVNSAKKLVKSSLAIAAGLDIYTAPPFVIYSQTGE
jgi:hypothetical protein